MPRPGGGADLPAAIQAADALLAKSQRGERDVIVLTDGQRFGWSDADTMHHWEQLGRQFGASRGEPGASATGGSPVADAPGSPRLWIVNVDPHRNPDPPNWSLDPIRVDFPVIPVQSEVTFHTAIEIHGSAGYDPPKDGLEFDVDGQFVRGVPAPPASDLIKGKIPLTFTYRFAAPGTHLVTLTVKPDAQRDTLPDDNRRDFVVEVTPPMPVVYVDGNPDPAALKTGEQTLLGALALEKDTTPALRVKAVSISEFKPELLAAGPDGGRPRVLVLCNVTGLTEEQRKAVEEFLDDGGGVLATLGGRADKDNFNLNQYRDGQGWLPARLTDAEGDETRPNDAAHVAVADATHPVMDRYRNEPFGGLADARFPKWWKVDLTGKDSRGEARGHPALADRRVPLPGGAPFRGRPRPAQYRAARRLLGHEPDDAAGLRAAGPRSGLLPGRRPLGGVQPAARPADPLPPGQQRPAGRFPPEAADRPGEAAVVRPAVAGHVRGRADAAAARRPGLRRDLREAGVYRLTTPEGGAVTYVSQPDPRESDLTASTEGERAEVAKVVPMQYESDLTKILTARRAPDRADEWGPIFLVVMIALLCAEVWMTRRMVKNRS